MSSIDKINVGGVDFDIDAKVAASNVSFNKESSDLSSTNTNAAILEVNDKTNKLNADLAKSVTTAKIPLTFNNTIQQAVGDIGTITGGKITDVNDIKGIAPSTNGFLGVYANHDGIIYAFNYNGQPITSTAYWMKVTFFY